MLKRRVKRSFKNESVSVALSVGDSETRRLGVPRNVKMHKNKTVKSLKMISPGAVQKKVTVTLSDALPLLNPRFGALPGIEISQ